MQTCAGGLANSMLVPPELIYHPQRESGCNTGEGITERETPVGMYHVCSEYKLGSLCGSHVVS